MAKSNSHGTSRAVKYGFIIAVGIFVCYHFWPHSTTNAFRRGYDTGRAALKAGYDEAQQAKGR